MSFIKSKLLFSILCLLKFVILFYICYFFIYIMDVIYLHLFPFTRCGIPVVLMGETGCGKTRLIKFMCALRAGSSNIRNMILVKVMVV